MTGAGGRLTLSFIGGRMGGPVVRFFVVVGEPCFSAAMICSLHRDWQPCIGSAHGLIQGWQACLAHPGEDVVMCILIAQSLQCRDKCA